MTANPFNNKATAAPAAPAAPVAPAAPTAPAAPADKSKKARKSPNRQMTPDERKFVLQNYANMHTSEIAQQLGLTRQQVYRTVFESRKNLQKRLDELAKAPDSPEKAAQMSKIQTMIDRLPAKPFGAGGGGTRKSSIDSTIDDLLSNL